MILIRYLILFVLFTLLYINYALAVPSIQSININNGNMNITGVGFGTKNTASPLKWDDFENGSAGQLLKNIDPQWIPDPPDRDGALYTDSLKHSGNLSVCNYTPGRSEFDTNHFTFSPSVEEVYVSYWWRIDNADTDDYGIVKLTRITSSTNAGGGGFYNGAGATGLSNMNPRYWGSPLIFYDAGEGEVDLDYLTTPFNSWVRIEMYKKVSTAGIADGKIIARTIGYEELIYDSLITRASGQTFLQDTVLLGLMMANPEGEYEIYIDDIYIDTTLSRVELGDAPHWDACSHREIQLPATWSDTGITAKINFGSFSSTDKLYVYVVDENGQHNVEGYPLTYTGSITNTGSASLLNTGTASIIAQ